MFQEHRLSNEAPVPSQVHEPAHEPVPVDAVKKDASEVSCVLCAPEAPVQERQVAARPFTAHTLTGVSGGHLDRVQDSRSLHHGVLRVQHEVLRTRPEVAVTLRGGLRCPAPQEQKREQDRGQGTRRHVQWCPKELARFDARTRELDVVLSSENTLNV